MCTVEHISIVPALVFGALRWRKLNAQFDVSLPKISKVGVSQAPYQTKLFLNLLKPGELFFSFFYKTLLRLLSDIER